MKRLIALALTCLLAACSSQHRVDPEPDFTNPDPAPDESHEPRLGEIESLISQAKLEIRRRDFDEARVKLHQVFRRDRWNPEANTLYQDLRIQLKQGDALYQEYLDLYEANKTRGDAFWFHLRPLLIKRGIKACEVEKHPEPTEEQRERIKELEGLPPPEGTEEARIRVALARLDEMLALDPMRADLIRRRAYLAPESTLKKYREMSEDDPGSGDALWRYAMVVLDTNGDEPERTALDILRRGWILDLPGKHLRGSIAGICVVYVGRILEHPAENRSASPSEVYGWLELALHFYRIADLTDPQAEYGETIRTRILEPAAENSIKLEDLSLKK
jgi:hypothetical protein